MKRLLATCFGLGRLPLAPGTWGSLPPVIIFGLLGFLGVSAAAISIVMGALVLAGFIICIKCAPASIAATGRSDPREVVADELAGQAVVFLLVSMISAGQILITAVFGFVLFRLFDIVKPWPMSRLEKLPSGWGILADDLMAGIYAALVLLVYVRLWSAEVVY